MIFQNKVFKDIRFWIVFFFIMRLYGITNPPLEIAHNWRQTTVTMVARNFYDGDANVFYPCVDMAGEKSGITGMEFPFFNYLIYLVSLVFGYQHWYGRLINLIVSSFGIWYFFKLVNKYFSPGIAFNAAFILIVSLWFAYSRKIMPDTFSMSILFAGMFYGSNYLDRENKNIDLALYFSLCLIALLSKISSAYILVTFIPLFINHKIKLKPKIFFIFSALTYVSIVAWWYFWWVPFLVKEFEYWHFFMGKNFVEGAKDIMNNFNQALLRFYDTSLKFTGFATFMAGLFFIFKNKEKNLQYIFLLSFFSFLVFVFKEGYNFIHHTYYVIPFVPVMALVAGYAISIIPVRRMASFVLIVIAVEGILNEQHDFRIKDSEKYKLSLEKIADGISNRDDRIVINGGGNPQQLYFTHHKGWTVESEKLNDAGFLNEIKNKGCKFIFVNKNDFKNKLNYPSVFENDFFRVYKF
ncbi:MAG: glycosyltransferase family 39 protein [Bacteroidota bacterium]